MSSLEKNFVVRLRLHNINYKVVYARANANLTSTCNMEKKKFLHQSVVPMAPTSWHRNIQATCFTFSVILFCCNSVCVHVGPLSRKGLGLTQKFFTNLKYPWPLQVSGIKHLLLLLLLFLGPIEYNFYSFRETILLTSKQQRKPVYT